MVFNQSLTAMVCATAVLAGSVASAFESAPKSFIVSNSTYSGHEEITRQAITKTLERFQHMGIDTPSKLPGFTADLDAAPKGLFGETSKNLVILGNFATDFPKYASTLSLASFWSNKHISDFENPQSQVLHFLRNYPNGKDLESAKATCMDSRSKIKHITQKAIEAWDKGQKDEALFLMGHALHVVQDSFSPAHGIRRTSGNFDVTEICYYGTKINQAIAGDGACYHKTPDGRDTIWNVSPDQQKQTQALWPDEDSIQCDKSNGYPDTDARKRSCLKHEARLARLATEKYLHLMLSHLSRSPDDRKSVEAFIASLDSRFFEGPTGEPDLDQKMDRGIMRCEGLSEQQVYGVEPMK